MDQTGRTTQNSKLIIWLVLIAAVIIIYAVKAVHDHAQKANTATAMAQSSVQSLQTASSDTNVSYKDGSYTASGSYTTPHSTELINVTVDVQGGTVTSASVQQTPTNHDAAEYQSAFQESYQQYVVGQKLSSLQLSRVSGSSLTSIGFNEAIAQIRTQAKSS